MTAVGSLARIARSVEVLETGSAVTVFTDELGKVAAIAKGARRLKSPQHEPATELPMSLERGRLIQEEVHI